MNEVEDTTIKSIRAIIDSTKLSYAKIVKTNLSTGEFKINYNFINKIRLRFLRLGLKFYLYKPPRYEDDAILFIFENYHSKLCLKILPDVWIATGEHARTSKFFETISASTKYLPRVYFSKIDRDSKSICYLYIYVEGVTISEIINNVNKKQKSKILLSLSDCLTELVIKCKLDVNFNDMNDFIIDPENTRSIMLIDYNSFFQPSTVLDPDDLLRMVKRRALKTLSKSGFDRKEIYKTLYGVTKENKY